MTVHVPTLTRHIESIEVRQLELTKKAEALLGRPLNLASPQQLSEALYISLRLPNPGMGAVPDTTAGHGSTGEAQLQV